MSKVHEIDPRVIQRTQRWLASQQQPDGSWMPDMSFIHEGAASRYNNDLLRITAYIAWALESSGYQGPEVERAREFRCAQPEQQPGCLYARRTGQLCRGFSPGPRVDAHSKPATPGCPHGKRRPGMVDD